MKTQEPPQNTFATSSDTTPGPVIDRVWIKFPVDDDADTSYLEQEGFEDRLQSYRNDCFNFVGCVAFAEVSYPVRDGHRRLDTFQSAGLWGIEDDSGRDYFEQVAREELSELRAHLETFGVDTSNFEELAEDAGVL